MKNRDMDGIFYAAAMALSYCLKQGYSHAGSDALIWMLGPIARLVSGLGNIRFYYEVHTGYVNPDLGIIIAPACAGINLLIISFAMAVFIGTRHQKGVGRKLSWFFISIFFAYAWVVPVNAVRILSSIYLYNLDIYNDWLTPAKGHRICGISIYFFFHCLFYFIMKKLSMVRFKGHIERVPTIASETLTRGRAFFSLALTGFVPLGWYVGITLIVPLLNGAFQQDVKHFTSHGLAVLCVSMMICGMILLFRTLYSLKFGKRYNEAKNPDCGG